MTRSHTGQYMAMQLHDTLDKWGLRHLVGRSQLLFDLFELTRLIQAHVIAMDNASNCDKTSEEFALLARPSWHETWRVRCLLHIVNLMAKVR
jgi:hypothetical protein